MLTTLENQKPISAWIVSFLVDKKAAISYGTVVLYKDKLKEFASYCQSQTVSNVEQISPDLLRRFMLHLEQTGHNSGGIHGYYRVIETFLKWYEAEVEPVNWKNPITRVKGPKLSQELLEPITLDEISAMLQTCENGFIGIRDKAIILCLLDCGARASEFLSLTLQYILRAVAWLEEIPRARTRQSPFARLAPAGA